MPTSPKSACCPPGPHRCSGARAAPSPSCSEGSWSPPAPCSARTPGSTLRAGESGCGHRQGELPAPGARLAPGADPQRRRPPPHRAGPLPTGTHQVALVPRGLIVAITALGTEGAAIAWAADTQASAAACAVAVASPVATAGLPGPAGTGCTGKDQPAGSWVGGSMPGGPSSPCSAASTPAGTLLTPQLLTLAVGAIGAGRAAERQPVHAQPLEEVRVLLPPEERGTPRSGP